MILREERAAAGSLPVRAAHPARLAAMLWSEVAVGSVELARIGLVAVALALQTIVLFSPGHFRPTDSPFFALLVTGGTLASLSISLLATLPLRQLLSPRTRRLIGVAGLVTLTILSIIGLSRGVGGVNAIVHGTPYSNDGAVMDLYAAKKVIDGHSPYVKTNIVTALAAINAPSTTTTPLMRGQFRGAQTYPSEAAIQQAFMSVLRYRSGKGVPIPPEFESKYNYPAGSFLFILPFVGAGLEDMRFLYALAVLFIGAYIWWRLPRSLRPLAPILLLADVPLVVLTAGGQPDPLYGLFLMIGFAELATPLISPAAIGLAVGTKQLAWFFVPFYLLLVARQYGWREAIRRTGLMSLVFLAMNLAFIAETPDGYLASITAPLADPMFPLGVGIIALFVSGLLSMLPKIAFTLAEIGAWTGSTLAFAWTRYLTPPSALVLGALPLFFAWRSLVNYFYLVPLLTLAVAAAHSYRAARSGADT